MRVEWADIVSAARETSEALNGKAWVQAGIKARVLLADLADEVERLRAGNEALENGLHLAWTDINQWLQLAGHQRDMMDQDLGWCPTQAGIDASRDRLACISEALRHAQSGQADVQAKRAEKLHADVAALAAVDPAPPSPSPADSPEARCREWNAKYPVGTRVRVLGRWFSLANRERLAEAPTAGRAYVVDGLCVVVVGFATGMADVDLSDVEPLDGPGADGPEGGE